MAREFLETLIKHSQNTNIFIGDNASTDDSISFVRKKFPSVKIIINKQNDGYAKGYNNVLSQISAKYYVLINSDIQVTKDWLYPIIRLMDNDKNISACQPKILDYKNKERFEYAGASGGFIDNLGYPFCRGRIFEDTEEDKGQYNNTKRNLLGYWSLFVCTSFTLLGCWRFR